VRNICVVFDFYGMNLTFNNIKLHKHRSRPLFLVCHSFVIRIPPVFTAFNLLIPQGRMEVVELVEVSGQGHQVIENFDDLILTVVPEGEEGAAGSGEGQRTIVVTEVRGPHHGMEDQNSKIESLQSRVEQLEDQVHFLEDELRLIRRKVVQQGQGNPMSTHSAIRKTVLEILRKQTVKISVSDFEDELGKEKTLMLYWSSIELSGHHGLIFKLNAF